MLAWSSSILSYRYFLYLLLKYRHKENSNPKEIIVKHPNQPRLSRTGDAPFLPPSSRPGCHFGGNLTSLDTKRQNHNSAILNQYDLYREATAFNKYTSAAFIFVSII